VDDDAGLARLGRLLRDQRSDVRAAAAMALRRMAASAAAAENAAIRANVREWLENRRTPPDVSLELARLVGEMGWSELSDAVRGVAGAGRPHADAVKEALDRLDRRRDPRGWEGAWHSDGLDVFESGPAPREGEWLVVVGDRAWRPGRAEGDATPDGESLVVDGVRHRRLMLVDGREALQGAGSTWWRLSGKELAEACEGPLASAPARVNAAIADWLVAPAHARHRAAALLRAGRADQALPILEELSEQKKVSAAVLLLLAQARFGTGERDGARSAATACLESAGKRDPARSDAEALLALLDADTGARAGG
jgi:hypothetical protein